jgi:hypothetical protein
MNILPKKLGDDFLEAIKERSELEVDSYVKASALLAHIMALEEDLKAMRT